MTDGGPLLLAGQGRHQPLPQPDDVGTCAPGAIRRALASGAAGEVAARLVELGLGAPAGKVPDMGGPEVREAKDLARAWLRAHRRRGPVLHIRLPGATFAAYRSGLHLAPDRAAGTVTFDQFLRREVG